MVRTVGRYRDKYGDIYVPLSINSTKVDVPIEIYETAINNGLSDYDIRRRIIENGYKPTYFIARPINADKGAMKLEIEEKSVSNELLQEKNKSCVERNHICLMLSRNTHVVSICKV